MNIVDVVKKKVQKNNKKNCRKYKGNIIGILKIVCICYLYFDLYKQLNNQKEKKKNVYTLNKRATRQEKGKQQANTNKQKCNNIEHRKGQYYIEKQIVREIRHRTEKI